MLCAESVAALVKQDAASEEGHGTYVDATFGRGGHSRKILCKLGPRECLIVLDRDIEAIAEAEKLARTDQRVKVYHGAFSDLQACLRKHAVERVDGVLMDLGVSSPQLDDASRGFSFSDDGPLDMRMDQSASQTAADWLNSESESAIAAVLRNYGEERFARRIAGAIVRARPLATTHELVAAIRAGQPRGTPGKHDATRTFQAIRMQVNDEIGELERGLQAAFESLALGGRLVVISFHSGEDRVVKRYFRSLTQAPVLPRRLPVRNSEAQPRAKAVVGPLRASDAERARNPRSRSALLRAVERSA